MFNDNDAILDDFRKLKQGFKRGLVNQALNKIYLYVINNFFTCLTI